MYVWNRKYVSGYKYFVWCMLVFIPYVGMTQNLVRGKTYEAVLSSHCKKMQGGGCTVDECCSLTFVNDSVQVRYFRRSSCVNNGSHRKTIQEHPEKGQHCDYTIGQHILFINGFKAYKKFAISDHHLLGFTSDYPEGVLFKEVLDIGAD